MNKPAPFQPLPPRPLISIIVPSFNQGAYIRQTIESCLEQDYRPVEIIVVDGASTDGTVDVLKSFGNVPELRWTSEPDDGVVDAVNKGLARARGDICGIQSSDDFYLPGVFSEVVELFAKHPEMALIYADTIKTDAAGREQSRWVSGPFSIENYLSAITLVLQPAAFFRRVAFEEVGGWSPDYFNADTECWLRMILRRPALKVDAFWAGRRMHAGQRDAQSQRILESYRRMTQTNPDIQQGPWHWRRAARCGRLLHTLRYTTGWSHWKRRWYLLRAVIAWPPVWRTVDLPGAIIPGWLGVRRRWRDWLSWREANR